MITCGTEQAQKYLAKGFVLLDVQAHVGPDGVFDLVTLADPEKMCLRSLRSGYRCLMDRGHRGRCTSHTFCCDGCNRYRSGDPYKRSDPEEGLVFCFMCVEFPNGKPRQDVYY